jgi:DNA-binding NtrC family response regulator
MAPRSSPRILVVEDEPLIRLDVAESLREAGYEAVEVSSADQAMEMLGRETFALILTDIDMPGRCNGLDLAWAAHQRDPALPVVLMSGRVLPRPEEMPRRLSLLAKPFQVATLLHIVGDALA